MSLRAYAILALALLTDCSACQGTVQHPRAGEKNTPEFCAKTSSDEDNCMACSAKPGCGYCVNAAAGVPSCQPGITGDNTPASCETPLVIGSTKCEGPPPPPPPG